MLQLYTFIYVWFTERKLTASASASIHGTHLCATRTNPLGQASAVVSAWDAYTQSLDWTMMKAAELEIKMNFHAGMPLVYI